MIIITKANIYYDFVVVQLLSRVWLFATSWTAARQALLSFSIFRSLLRFVSTESMMLSNHLILCHPLLLLPSIFSIIRVFCNEWLFASGGQSIGVLASASVLSVNIQGWFPLGLTGLISLPKRLSSLLQHHNLKSSILQHSAFFTVQVSHSYMTTGKTIALTVWTFVGKEMPL